MSVDFFETAFKESDILDKTFGICDDQDGSKAYTNINIKEKNSWIAIVENSADTPVAFTPIDHCIVVLKEGTKDQESTCDGMLIFTESLYLVELKNQGTGGWLSEAKAQLESTIQLIRGNHNLSNFKYKKAYACNKKHPSFTVIDAAERKAFFERTKGFRLDAQVNIKI